jgi:hypothetical protein
VPALNPRKPNPLTSAGLSVAPPDGRRIDYAVLPMAALVAAHVLHLAITGTTRAFDSHPASAAAFSGCGHSLEASQPMPPQLRPQHGS